MKPTYTMEMGREYWLHCSVYNIVLWIQWNLNTCIVFNVKTKVTRHICLEKLPIAFVMQCCFNVTSLSVRE